MLLLDFLNRGRERRAFGETARLNKDDNEGGAGTKDHPLDE